MDRNTRELVALVAQVVENPTRSVPRELRSQIAQKLRAVSPAHDYTTLYQDAKTRVWLDALSRERTVTFRYDAGSNPGEFRVVVPEGINEHGNLAGYDIRKRAKRSFDPRFVSANTLQVQ